MYSNNQNGSPYFRQIILENNQNYNELRDYDRGGPAKTILRPVPLIDARYMLIDWLNPFRAIYFPLAHQAGPGFEDLCVYLMIDFRLRQGVQIRNGAGSLVPLAFDRERGLTYRHHDVLSFDLKGIYDYLILPAQLRAPEKGLYRTERRGDELITLWDRTRPSPGSPLTTTRRQFVRHIDLVTVINDNFGVDVTWQPYQHSVWVFDFLIHVTTLALGFVPGVGPLLAVSFSVGMQVIIDPDGFREQNPLHLAADIVAALISSGGSARANLPQGHQRSRALILPIKSGSVEPAEPEPPYVKNLGFEPWPESQAEESVDQNAEDEGDRLDETKVEDHWEEAVEQQKDVEEEGAAKQGAEVEGNQITELGATDEPNQNTEQTSREGEYPFPEVKAKDEVETNAEEKVDDEVKQIASKDIETEKTQLGSEQGVDSKETSNPEHKAEDQGDEVVEPKAEDEVNHPKEEKAGDEGNPTANQDVETEKEPSDAQGVESKETALPGQEAGDQGNQVVEPKPDGEVNHTGEEKAKDDGEQGTKDNVKDEEKEVPEPNVEDEAKPAAESKVEKEGKEPADKKVASDKNEPAKPDIKDEVKIADSNAKKEEEPATEPKTEVVGEETAD